MKVVVTGISGGMGRLVARGLLEGGHEVLGIDTRPWPDAPKGVEMFETDIRKRPAEDVFRARRPDAAIHMATTSRARTPYEERSRINLYGTRAIFDHCHAHGVRHVVFVGRHTLYGAASDSPLYHTEEDPPMAGPAFPEMADLVAADLYAGSTLWRHADMETAVLRIAYTLGPSGYGTLANFLRGPFVPTVLGFDPLFHFLHEGDAARAIVLALEKRLRGVYNVAGPQPIPLALLCRVTGRRTLPIPEFLYPRFLGRFGLPNLATDAIHHVKYPVVVDAAAFRNATGFQHEFDEMQTMNAFRWA
ncbi:MAG: NAD-dependent epimerase/dehydratase family protein [Planctomycetes bacterium]|nr:NAD-dependent epimerase/dehydratase family protein [Planctomycetota bacterium]